MKISDFTLEMATTARTFQKIFVGNLPWTVSHQELRNFFKEFGSVISANVVFDKSTGCSRGFGFVVFSNNQVLRNLESKSRLVLEGQQLNIQPTIN